MQKNKELFSQSEERFGDFQPSFMKTLSWNYREIGNDLTV